MLRFYRLIDKAFEYCFYIETSDNLTKSEIDTLKWLLAETFQPDFFGSDSFLEPAEVSGPGDLKDIEIGPRLNFETAYSTNAVAICHWCGLKKVKRLERSRRYMPAEDTDYKGFIDENHDRMTEIVYREPLSTFQIDMKPEEVKTVPLMEEGIKALQDINIEYGLGFDRWDLDFYHELFVKDFGRNPTNVECYHLSQANSEHSRHWFFRGRLVIDGIARDSTLIDVIKSTLVENPSNSIIAFKDNSSAIRGFEVKTIIPREPGTCSPFRDSGSVYHIIFTAETHNFPSGVAPFPGAETGTGGRIRDVQATGRGGLVIAGTAGYATGNLHLPGYRIPGEVDGFKYPSNLASPLKIMVEESNGASDYGNKFGEPVIQGFTRTYGQVSAGSERREWVKPIMFTGGIGQIDSRHVDKKRPEKGMLIIQVGGPAYRIGLGGGSASSLIQGENREDLDFNAVQRGNAEMEQKLNRVIRACIEMGDENPVLSIHDQGAGGPCNVLTEIVDPEGGRIEIRNITVGDKTMSLLEIWVAEYQERNAFLIYPEDLKRFKDVCQREKVNCEVLGEITGDGRMAVHDSHDDTTPVDLELSKVLGRIPQKEFRLKRIKKTLKPLEIPENLDLEKTIRDVFRLPAVGSKGFLVRKVDRSVTGLVAGQQCCGPLQLPVADVSVIAQSHFGLTGAAISIGEQPLKILVDSRAGARMAAGEALTNIMWAKVDGIDSIKCSVNWMWPAKLPGEGAELWDAANALSDFMKSTGIAADGGKDSVSMAAQVQGETVKAPGEIVVSAYVTVPDIRKVVTPDMKMPGKSRVIFIDISGGKNRLGGSALAQTFGQTGNTSPDVEDTGLLVHAFKAIQEMVDEGIVLAGHDRSDGGLLTAVAEMIMSGNCGLEMDISRITVDSSVKDCPTIVECLFSEELGAVIEYLPEDERRLKHILEKHDLRYFILGDTIREKKLVARNSTNTVLDIRVFKLLEWWESTSDEIEKQQMDPGFAAIQKKNHIRKGPVYNISLKNGPIQPESSSSKTKPEVAIIREEGSNGDREMTSAFHMAGFNTWDVTMTDLLNGNVSLDRFRGAVFVGGFSYADVMDSAKGWAGIIRFNRSLSDMFDSFYRRKDTFSLGVCNGCQLMTLLGWVPWRGIEEIRQPRFISNPSGRFESRWVTVKVLKSPSIMLGEMEGAVMGIWVAHREGYLHFPDKDIIQKAEESSLFALAYVDDEGIQTEEYPYNPNSSPKGYTALCSADGRHLAMMPHPERAFMLWQWPWIPENMKKDCDTADPSPWLRMFLNARKWCEESQ